MVSGSRAWSISFHSSSNDSRKRSLWPVAHRRLSTGGALAEEVPSAAVSSVFLGLRRRAMEESRAQEDGKGEGKADVPAGKKHNRTSAAWLAKTKRGRSGGSATRRGEEANTTKGSVHVRHPGGSSRSENIDVQTRQPSRPDPVCQKSLRMDATTSLILRGLIWALCHFAELATVSRAYPPIA